MKVLLANLPWLDDKEYYAVRAGSRWPHRRKKEEYAYYFPFPFYLATAAAVLKDEGHEVMIKDCITEEISPKDFIKLLKSFKPDICVYETSTPSIYVDYEWTKRTKDTIDTTTVLCGPHVSALPKEALEKDFVDIVLLGEYEYVLRDLVKAKSEKKDPLKLKGVCGKKGKEIVINERAPLIEDLDKLPYPSREQLPMHKYQDSFCKHTPNMQMITSRGCPYRCIYCLESHVYYGKPSYRVRSAESVLDEIEFLIKKYKIKEIYFDDATFSVNQKRVIDISHEFIKRGVKIPWSCMVDCRLEENTIKEMKKAGCIAIKFGVETASPEIQANIEKNLDLEYIKRFVKLCKKYNVETHATFMFGLPGENKKTIKQTMDYAFKLDPDTLQFAIATPYPGTPMFDMAKKKGWLVCEDWSRYDGSEECVISYPNLSREEILMAAKKARKKVVMKVAFNPRQTIQYLSIIYGYKGFRGLVEMIWQKIVYIIKPLSVKKAFRK